MLTTRTIHELTDVDPRDWDVLLDHCPSSTVLQRRQWIGSWWRTFRGAGRRLHIVAAYEGPRLVGLAPLFAQPRRVRDRGHADYQTFPAWGGSPEVVDALVDAVRERFREGASAVLSEIPQGSPLALRLERETAGPGPTSLRLTSTTPCPRLRLRDNPEGMTAILRKQSIRRDLKKLAGVGPIAVQHHTKPADMRPLLTRLFRQHIERWAGTPSPSLFLDDRNRALYASLVEEVGHLGLRSRDEFIWYTPSFDPEFARSSPGEVLLKSLIEYAQAEGCTAFDFARGDERFKSRFASSVQYNASFGWVSDRWRQRLRHLARDDCQFLARSRGRLRLKAW